MANFDKTNWYYLFIVYPPNPVKWSQAHSTGPHPIQLVPKFQYWLIQCQNGQFWQNKLILSFHCASPQPSQVVQGSFNWSSPHSTGPQTSVVDYTISKSTKWITWLERPKGAKDEEKRPRVPPANSGSGTLFHIFLSHRLCALQRPVHAWWMRACVRVCVRACTLWNCYRFFFLTGLVCYDTGWLYQLKKSHSNVRGLCNGQSTQG